MSTAEEWKQYKLKSLEHLKALTFTFAEYSPPSAEWDHDHCEGCGATFALFDAPEILHSGYFTTFELDHDSTRESEVIRQARESGLEAFPKPDSKEWVCPECFEAFRTTLNWKVKSRLQT
jgi:hypothetical protein